MSRPLRILVVDNNLADQEMIREMLPVQGLGDTDVTMALEGGEAIALLREVVAGRGPAPDVILLDLHLSRVHGREVLAFVRNEPALHGLPVIMFTTAASDEVRNDCLRLGANDFLLKPRTLAGFSEVASSIRHLADGRRGRPSTRTAAPS